MPFHLAGVNYLAVLVSALVAFLVGGLWYTALFGKLWVKLHGYTPEHVKEMQVRRPPPAFFGGMIASYVLLALVLALLLSGFQEKTVLTGVALGALLWAGPTAAIAFTGHLAGDKPLLLYLIDAGCPLVYLVLMGAILGAW
jgi:hypothetical protein